MLLNVLVEWPAKNGASFNLVTPIPGDVIKIILASLIAPRVRKALH